MDSNSSSGRPTHKRKTIAHAEDTGASSGHTLPSKKTKQTAEPVIIDLTIDSPPPPSKKNSTLPSDAPAEERRLRRFRWSAPHSYLVVKERALTQRLTVLSRVRGGTDENPFELVRVAGSTGNVYTIRIDNIPRCDCPHALKGNQCKHIVYVMLRVLKAPEKIAYQLALLSSELRELMKNTTPVPGVKMNGKDGTMREGEDPNRKPVEGECPICYDELKDKEHTVYCKSRCGNNIHSECMQKWAAISKGEATCPYCRARWPNEKRAKSRVGELVLQNLRRNEEGYFNVAEELGLDTERDDSSYYYNDSWLRGRYGIGGWARRRRYSDGEDWE